MCEIPCTAQPSPTCDDCSLVDHQLMCRYEKSDTTHFFMIGMPFFVTAIGGMIYSGYGWWLLGWLAYSLFFFFVFEARVLCSHCPYWAEEGRILHCHANYGVIKIWKYRPGPMSRLEQALFIIGALLWAAYPLALLCVGQEYLLVVIGLTGMISFIYLLWRNICTRCINFSCPLNHVPKSLKDAYLKHNPEMRKAWEACGYNCQ